uniref:Uncharacterized protein n=1 Tax=Oryza rufipogon TaxID=4529 RepID=A0A0E0QHC4_ORYRU
MVAAVWVWKGLYEESAWRVWGKEEKIHAFFCRGDGVLGRGRMRPRERDLPRGGREQPRQGGRPAAATTKPSVC